MHNFDLCALGSKPTTLKVQILQHEWKLYITIMVLKSDREQIMWSMAPVSMIQWLYFESIWNGGRTMFIEEKKKKKTECL